jgi:hypothetical protein
MKKHLGYFSHPVSIFNTDEESEISEYLSQMFNGHIICPNMHFREQQFQPLFNIIEKSDVLFVREHRAAVGTGSYAEIVTAIKNNIPVYIIKGKIPRLEIYQFQNIEIIAFSNSEYAIINSTKCDYDKLPFLRESFHKKRVH